MTRYFILLVFSVLVFSSCLKKYIVTEKEIRQHYDTTAVKPNYKFLKNKDERLFVATFGLDTLQPILFIHGAPGRWDGFIKQLDDSIYQKNYHLLAPDRPGYGRSYLGKKYRKVSIQKQADMLEKALTLNKSGKKTIIVSRSYGAPIGAYMVAKKPELYSKLIMMAPAIDPNSEKFFKFSKYGKWFIFRWFLPKRLNTATDEKYAHEKELKQIEPIWGTIKVPTTVMYGGKDWVVTPANFEYAKSKLGNSELYNYIYIPDAGHRISRSHPELLRKQVFEK